MRRSAQDQAIRIAAAVITLVGKVISNDYVVMVAAMILVAGVVVLAGVTGWVDQSFDFSDWIGWD